MNADLAVSIDRNVQGIEAWLEEHDVDENGNVALVRDRQPVKADSVYVIVGSGYELSKRVDHPNGTVQLTVKRKA